MMQRHDHRRLTVATVIAVCALVGCKERQASPAPAKTPAADSYTVRGRVVALPDQAGMMQIHHEAIPDFKNQTGQVAGMNAMAMPFPLAADVDLGDLKVDDKVEFTLKVQWSGAAPYQITAIRKLAADTELDLGQSAPAGEADDHDDHEH